MQNELTSREDTLPEISLLVNNVGPQDQALAPLRKASILLNNLAAIFYRARHKTSRIAPSPLHEFWEGTPLRLFTVFATLTQCSQACARTVLSVATELS